MNLLPAIAPVSLIIFFGFIAGRTLTLERQTLSQLTIYILVPALIAESLYNTKLSAQSTTGLVVGYLLATLTIYLITSATAKLLKFPPQVQKSLIATTLFANNGNMGLPLITFALGTEGLERAIVYLIAASIMMAAVGPALLKGEGLATGVKLTLKLPLLWAMLGGLGLRVLKVELPLRLDEGLGMLGQASIPIALVILGMQLAQTSLRLGKYEVFASAMRLLLAPGITYGVGIALGLTGLDLQVLVMQGAMPTAVNTLVWVTEFGGDPPRVARTIIVSTLMSFLTIPLVLSVINAHLNLS